MVPIEEVSLTSKIFIELFLTLDMSDRLPRFLEVSFVGMLWINRSLLEKFISELDCTKTPGAIFVDLFDPDFLFYFRVYIKDYIHKVVFTEIHYLTF